MRTVKCTRTVLALLSTLFVLAGPVLVAPAASAATSAPDADTDDAGIQITLDEVTPWLNEDGTLTVSGSIVNAGSEDIAEPSLALQMSNRALSEEYRLDSWSSRPQNYRTVASLTDDGPAARKQASKQAKKDTADSADKKTAPTTKVDAEFTGTLPAGESAGFSMSVPAENLELPTKDAVSAWGPRGLSVEIGDASGPLADSQAFTTWYPDPTFDATQLSLLVPVTLPGFSPTGLVSPTDLDRAIASGGSLDAITRILKEPQVSLALDPRIIASFDHALDRQPPADGSSGQDRSSDGREPTNGSNPDGSTTGGSDTDPTESPGTDKKAAHETDSEDSGSNATQNTDSTADKEGTDSTDPPAEDGSANEGEAAEDPADEDRKQRLSDWYTSFLDQAKKHTVIALPYGDPDRLALRSAGLSELDDFAESQKTLITDVLPDARTDVAWPVAGSAETTDLKTLAESGTDTVILDDRQQPSLTGIRDNAHSTVGITADGSATVDTLISDSGLQDLTAASLSAEHSAAALSRLVATSAAVQAEAPYRSRQLLLALPRAAADGDWADTVETLSTLPWVSPKNVKTVLASDPTPRGILQAPGDTPRITGSVLTPVRNLRTAQHSMNTAYTDPEVANAMTDRILLGCTSVAWISGGDGAKCVENARATADDHDAAIHLEDGSSVLLVTGEKTKIPVTIVNDGPTEATLQVRMQPRSPQLKTKETEVLKVPAAETMRVDVPVEGIANGDVSVDIEMITAAEVVLPETSSLMVRVRADWENIGTAVVGLGLAIVFVFGLAKTFARGRRKIPEQQLAAAVARARDTTLQTTNDEPEER